MADYIYRDEDRHHDIDCPHLSRLVRSEEKRRARNRRGQQANKCEQHNEKPNEDG
jgi:hypothetical protein